MSDHWTLTKLPFKNAKSVMFRQLKTPSDSDWSASVFL